MPPSGKKLAILLVILCLVAAASAALYNRYLPTFRAGLKTASQTRMDETDLAGMPDALIRSSSLAKLPRDLLRLPLARDVLTEDIVNYYEHHDGKLALSGTLRRIAYENKLQLPERLIEMALDAPAEVALWNDGRGRLRHFAAAMTENTLARAITLLLPLHSQVTSTKKWPEMNAASLILSYGHQHLTLFTRGDRVVMVSDGLLSAEGNDAGDGGKGNGDGSLDKRQQKMVHIIAAMLTEKPDQPSALAKSFNLPGGLPEKGHEIVIAAKALAFGYERFAPGLGGFRFAFDEAGGWQSAVLFDGQAAAAPYASLWRALPHGAAFCASLPADWTALSAVAARWRENNPDIAGGQRIDELLAKFGPAAVCWYGDSRLYTPLFATFSEEKLSAADKEALLQVSRAATKVVKPDESPLGPDGGMWRGSIASDYGVGEENGKGQQSGERFLYPAAAVWSFTMGQGAAKDVAFFSPDAALVQKALQVAAKKFPALSDDAPVAGSEQLIAFIHPAMLSELMRREIFNSTPQYEAENFLGIVDFLFTPRFQALARYAPQWISFHAEKHLFSSAGWQWYPLRWDRINTSVTGASATDANASKTGAAVEAIEP
jgi:uncharacterized protein YfaA (DUF2138 family)